MTDVRRLVRWFSAPLFAVLPTFAAAAPAAAVPADPLAVLCYHEIAEQRDALDPYFAVAPAQLAEHLEWLTRNGYHFVSLQQVIAARTGGRSLPAKPVLLTFDDGYRSAYEAAWPLLKHYRAPAVLDVVGSWLESGDPVNMGDSKAPRRHFLTWPELREMQASGLVEIASHTHDMHHGISGNPQSDREPAATTRAWLVEQGRYETEAAYRARIRADLAANNALIRKRLGRTPRAVVWPYGSYNAVAFETAAALGMPVTMTLDDGPNRPDTPLSQLRRSLMSRDTDTAALAAELAVRAAGLDDNDRAAKVMHVDLDNIHDPSPVQQTRNLGLLLDRINAMRVNTVYLQAYSDPDGNGSADALYFRNRHLPMKADLFNHVAWQILKRTRARRVYAWMPMMAFELPAGHATAGLRVQTEPHRSSHLNMGYHRLSPFSPSARQVIRDIYEDLSRSAHFAGLLFHDDITLSDYEDNSPAARKVYRSWGLPDEPAKLRASEPLLLRWSARKTAFLDDFAGELAAIVRREVPDLRTARNMYAQVVLNPYSETWYSQSLASSLKHYDFTAVMVMPYMEQVEDPKKFYRQMVEGVQAVPGAMRKVIFELQATDWRDGRRIPDQEMADTVASLYEQGVIHVGYYPDNLFQNHPDTDLMRAVFDRRDSSPKRVP